jgi:hypothetical protein
MDQTPSLVRLKRFLESAAPASYAALRLRWYKCSLYQMLTVIVRQRGAVVQGGPFQGMKYLPALLSSEKSYQYAVLPKILGCYEAELHAPLRGRGFSRLPLISLPVSSARAWHGLMAWRTA